MNGIKPSFGMEFTNDYDEAGKKLCEFVNAMNKLTPVQQRQFLQEYAVATGNAALLQFLLNYWGCR